MEKYTLLEVITPKDNKNFIDFPKSLYKNNKYWVCPLDSDIASVFDPKKNEQFEHGQAIRYLAYDQQGKIVGRIAAFYNNEIAQAGAKQEGYPLAGGCGFFESIDNQQVANMLFDAAALWLKDKGFEAMDGPINFGDRDQWWGLLVKGFEYQPLYANPYNPEYYIQLFENYGFKNYFNQYTYKRELKEGQLNPALYEKVKRLEENKDFKFQCISMKEIDKVAENFRYIYNKAWAVFTGIKPIDEEHAKALIAKLKPIVDPHLIIFAYHQDKPIGFYVSLPDLNRVICTLKGKSNTFAMLKMLYLMKVRKKADRIFGLIFGVIPEFQGKSIEAGMIHQFEKMIASKQINYKSMELAWIGDFNPVMMRMVENYVCATKFKTHVTYRFLFNPEQEFLRAPRMGVKRNK